MKQLILVAAPPAHGKDFVAKRICERVHGTAYLDKDALAPLLHRAFALAGERVNMDGAFYRDNLRDAEYETLVSLALSALEMTDCVVVNAPFLQQVRDEAYMKALKARANALGAALLLVWVSVSDGVCYERMRARNAERDRQKLLNFAEYRRTVDTSAPLPLQETEAVDRLIVFDNENEKTFASSLRTVLDAVIGDIGNINERFFLKSLDKSFGLLYNNN